MLSRYHKRFENRCWTFFTDIPESTQHQDFLGIIILDLLFGKVSFITKNLISFIGLNTTYEQSKLEYLFVNT